MPPRLPLEHMAAIAAASGSEPPAHPSDLARELGLGLCTVWRAMKRIRSAGGWYSELVWSTCAHCGKPLVSDRVHPRRTHTHCAISAKYSRLKARRPGLPPEVAASRLAAKRARAHKAFQKRWARLSPEDKAAALAPLLEATRRAQVEAAAHATRRRKPWTLEDDRYLIDHPAMPLGQLALDLGRTYPGVSLRRTQLRAAAQASVPARGPHRPAGSARSDVPPAPH